jgi:hypothetical protein
VPRTPLVDVRAQYAALIPELKERFAAVVEAGVFILGPNVRAFEEEAAARLGVPHAIGVANGTDALVLVLQAMDIGEGDEVVCPAFTFYATAEAIARVGATPVFVDIDATTMNLDPADVEPRLTERTKAIMPVHLFGRPAPLAELAALGLPLIEDAAQAFGAPGVASVGAASTFSFFPTKNLFCLGDGGLVVAQDGGVAERVRMLRFHGSRDKQRFDYVGTNSRLDELRQRCCASSPASTRGTRAAWTRPATRIWPGRARRCLLTISRIAHMYVVRTRGATGSRQLTEAEIDRRLLPHTAPPPAGTSAGSPSFARRSARRRRTSRCRCGRESAPAAGARSRGRALCGRRRAAR